MNRIRIYLSMILTTGVLFSCVDDFQDANPPRLLDSPAVNSMTITDDVINGGETTTIALSVTDAPAGLASVTVTDVNDIGVAAGGTINVLSNVEGITSGVIEVEYTAPLEYAGIITISAFVSDAQVDEKGEDAAKSSVARSVEVDVLCPAKSDAAGAYNTDADGGFGDGAGGSAPYTGLAATVTITKLGTGQYSIDDMSFGLYPIGYGDTAPSGTVTICGSSISDNGDTDQYGDPFTITGTLNDNGTINLEWSNTWGDSGVVTLTPQ